MVRPGRRSVGHCTQGLPLRVPRAPHWVNPALITDRYSHAYIKIQLNNITRAVTAWSMQLGG